MFERHWHEFCANGSNHNRINGATIIMTTKKILLGSLTITIILTSWLNFGFYKYHREFDTDYIFFIKKYMTLKVEFRNMAASEAGPWTTDELSGEEKNRQ